MRESYRVYGQCAQRVIGINNDWKRDEVRETANIKGVINTHFQWQPTVNIFENCLACDEDNNNNNNNDNDDNDDDDIDFSTLIPLHRAIFIAKFT